MTINDAISKLRRYIFSDAPRARQEQNKALKPGVLREMMLFQWVWIEVLKSFNDRDKVSAYYSKHYDFTGGTAFCCGYPGITFSFYYADYGKTWLAYRCKPEQED